MIMRKESDIKNIHLIKVKVYSALLYLTITVGTFFHKNNILLSQFWRSFLDPLAYLLLKPFKIIRLSNLSTLIVTGENYCRSALCALNILRFY